MAERLDEPPVRKYATGRQNFPAKLTLLPHVSLTFSKMCRAVSPRRTPEARPRGEKVVDFILPRRKIRTAE
jgi:hypothetical protein